VNRTPRKGLGDEEGATEEALSIAETKGTELEDTGKGTLSHCLAKFGKR